MEAAVRVSRLVWDCAVSRGLLDEELDSVGGRPKYDDDGAGRWRCHGSLLAAAEAVFPLVPLVCSRVLSLADAAGGSYAALRSAAAVPSPSCVAWIAANRHRLPERGGGRAGGGIIITGGEAPGIPLGVPRRGDSNDSATLDYCEVVVKEVTAVLVGLCCGGHVKHARALLGDGDCGASAASESSSSSAAAVVGTLPLLWDGRRIERWCRACYWQVGTGDGTADSGCFSSSEKEAKRGQFRERVREHIKSSVNDLKAMVNGCGGVDVGAVKWLLSALRIGWDEAPWALRQPLRFSLYHGRMEAVNWLLDEFDLVKRLPQSELVEIAERCAMGEAPCNFKWYLIMGLLVKNTHSTADDCEFCVDGEVCESLLCDARTVEVVKWVLSKLPADTHSILQSTWGIVFENVGDVSLAEWLVTERPDFKPTPSTFVSACSIQMERGSSLAKWVSTRVTLTQDDLIKSMTQALVWNNTEIAEWLQERFHVMDVVNSDPVAAGRMLVGIFKYLEGVSGSNNVSGLKWLIQHLSQPFRISEKSIHVAFTRALHCAHLNSAFLLLDMFPGFNLQGDALSVSDAFDSFLSNFQFKERFMSSFGSSSLLTPDFVGKCLISSSYYLSSSKAIKWVISRFNLQYNHIKLENNKLLLTLLNLGKSRCAKWLLDSFDIPLADIIEMAKGFLPKVYAPSDMNLAAWKILLRKYPSIDATMIQEHFMQFVVMSPHIALFTMREYGLSLNQIHDFCSNIFFH
ncbi:hypothetical protein Pelo_9689 [Pelomyxa schiedti]|nr:hypothetical protein Pelo_9689 [Pelomyxa schiedti]